MQVQLAQTTSRAHMESGSDSGYELRYRSLFSEGRGLSFPCDSEGHVDLDAISERAKSNYLAARALVGREYGYPVVVKQSI